MSLTDAITLAVALALFTALHLGLLHLLKRGFRWVADKIDLLCGLDTSRH